MKFEYNLDALNKLRKFCEGNLGNISKARHLKAEAELGTLEDGIHLTIKHIATEGDWIIKGVQGEFYPCKPHIFDATYELVSDYDNNECCGHCLSEPQTS